MKLNCVWSTCLIPHPEAEVLETESALKKWLRKEVGLPEGVVFHSLRNTFATRLENLGVPKNHISQLLGHEDGNMALDVYSDGLAIEPLRKSIAKLNYGDLVEEFIQSKFHELFQIK